MKTMAAVLALIATTSSAHATMHYGFIKESLGTIPGAPYTLSFLDIDMFVADGADSDGRLIMDEIISFELRANSQDSVTLAPGGDGSGPRDAEAMFIEGSIADGVFRNFTPDFMFELTAGPDGLWSGWYLTDNLSADACYLSAYRCIFTGRWARVDVPEPPALAALLPVLLLPWRRRR